MKAKLILCAVLMSAGSLVLNAQAPRQHNGMGQGPGQNAEMVTPEARADRMAKHLELTAGQKAKVLELFKKQEMQMNAAREEMKKMREKNEKISDAQREKFAAQRKANDAELEKIIGAEKFAKLQAEREGQMQKMKEKRGQMQGNAPQGPNRPQMQNPEMRAKRAEKMKENFTPEMRAERLKTELGLTDAEKEALVQLFESEKKQIAEERKQKMDAMKLKHEAEMEKIIGKEKMAKYLELQKSRQEKAKKNRKQNEV